MDISNSANSNLVGKKLYRWQRQTELMQVKLVLHILNEGDTQSVPQTIIELIYNNPNITREDIAKQLGVSTKTIGRYLKKLENKVKFVGSGYSGHWEIIQK